MKTPLTLLLIFCAVSAQAADVIPKSTSPDGRHKIVLNTAVDKPCYSIVDSKLKSLGIFPTDFESRANEMCLRSEVSWRKDGAYFVLFEPQTRYNGFVIVGHRTSTGFSQIPFDIQTILKATGLDWHLAHANFTRWLPQDQIEIMITAETTTDTWKRFDFVLDLKDSLKVVSWKKETD